MNKRIAFGGILVLVLLLAVPVTAAFADCVPGNFGTPGDDVINCSGTTNSSVYGESVPAGTGGNDIIVNSGTVNGSIFGDGVTNGTGGNDTIINTGTVNGFIYGSSQNSGTGGNDTIINSGTVGIAILGDGMDNGDGGNDHINHSGIVTGSIYGDQTSTGNGGDDVIVVSGIVTGQIYGDFLSTGDGGNDSVVIRDRANVQGTIYGDHITNAGTGGIDALHFKLDQREATPEEYLAFVAAMDAASASGGSVCWLGNCYNWLNFEHLSWQLDYSFGPAAIYFIEIPAVELPAYGDGSAPFCTFFSGQHGPKWIASEQCGDFTDASALDVVCLNDTGMWSSDYVSGVGATADGKLSFSTSQHGICGVYPSS